MPREYYFPTGFSRKDFFDSIDFLFDSLYRGQLRRKKKKRLKSPMDQGSLHRNPKKNGTGASAPK